MERHDSPAKRQKFHHDSSQDLDEIEDVDADVDETVETLPLPRPGHINQTSQYITQPTQLIDRAPSPLTSPNARSESVVQVAASSSPPPVQQSRPIRPGGLLAGAMAPAGTTFRTPYIARPAPVRAQAPVMVDEDEEDDGPTYRGGSSDDEQAQTASDIKPTKFGKSEERVEESPAKGPGNSLFKQIMNTSGYQPGVARAKGSAGFGGSAFDSRNRGVATSTSTTVTARKPTGDSMASAYGSTTKRPRQVGPSRAQPVVAVDEADDTDIKTVNDIPDFGVRSKASHIRKILPHKSASEIYRALKAKHMSIEDALDFLAEQEERSQTPAIDLTGSDDELAPTPAKAKYTSLPQQKSMQAKYGTKSINSKWSSTQPSSAPASQPFPKPSLRHVSPPAQDKKFRRLVRGRRHASSPVAHSPEPEAKPKSKSKARNESEESEESEGVLSEEEQEQDQSFDARLLKFFNTCEVGDLADVATLDKETAAYLLSNRPFRSLNAVRSVPSKTAKSAKSRTKPKPIGDKIVDKCEDMFQGYEAVDQLVAKCEALGRPVAREMKDWGVDVFGTKNEEVDFVSLGEGQSSVHDSGIGTPSSELEVVDEIKSRKTKFLSQPTLMNHDIKMKEYQVVGVNWLSLLYKHGLSCILADDMGLGKTCQVIAFLAHLLEIGVKGPHLVVVPASTLENWLQEFHKFCPALVVEPLYGTEKERFEIRDRIEAERENINVVITTQHTAKAKYDIDWLRHFEFTCAVYDEAHFLRTATSQVYEKLMRIKCRFRLLLTGTPLQNNLHELMSLLGFIMPTVFKEKKEQLTIIFNHKAKTGDDTHDALLSTQRINRARSMLTPFILRRKKYQVLKDIPNKISRVEHCEMSQGQIELYTFWQEKARRLMELRAEGNPATNESANVLMKLRQAAIHELLFHKIYDKPSLLRKIAKKCLDDPLWAESNPDLIFTEINEYSDLEMHQLCVKSPAIKQFALQNEEWMDSGKVIKMIDLLSRFREEGARTLIFSQFTMVLDILELVMDSLSTTYLRLDGSTPVAARQDMIDAFNKDPEIQVFMLSTKAGGAGINLAAANKIIIFDSSFNPQDDIQAENRAHRIGQTKEVEVVRLVTRGTIEEQIHNLGKTKLALDSRVAGETDAKEPEKQESEGMKMVEKMMFEKLQEGDAAEETKKETVFDEKMEADAAAPKGEIKSEPEAQKEDVDTEVEA